jgi:hypothetical protein
MTKIYLQFQVTMIWKVLKKLTWPVCWTLRATCHEWSLDLKPVLSLNTTLFNVPELDMNEKKLKG